MVLGVRAGLQIRQNLAETALRLGLQCQWCALRKDVSVPNPYFDPDCGFQGLLSVSSNRKRFLRCSRPVYMSGP